MRPRKTLLLVGTLVGLLTLLEPSSAQAFKYRRPNLVGSYTDRRMTNPVNAMTLIGGPGSSFTFGQRYDERSIEGGMELGHAGVNAHPPTDSVGEAWTRFGVGFGLLPYLDAGAVFLNFKWAPNFDFTEVLVYMTQAFNLGDWELGVRLSFLSPSKANGLQINPGLMAVYRGGGFKLETGAFSGIGLGSIFFETEVPDSEYIGLNVPARATVNLTPEFYLGGDTGIFVPRFDAPDRTTIPLGLLVGYTWLNKDRLIDFSLAFKFDEFLYLAPAAGVGAIQPDLYRFNFGITMHKMSVAPPK